jgi:hypothetical protein
MTIRTIRGPDRSVTRLEVPADLAPPEAGLEAVVDELTHALKIIGNAFAADRDEHDARGFTV